MRTTTNFGLKITEGNDDWRDIFDDNADNMDTLDGLADKLQHGLAIIVDGDTCATAVPVGGYAYVRDNTHGLAEGLYQNTSNAAFPVSGGTANSTVFTAVPGGLGSEVTSLNNNVASLSDHIENFSNSNGVIKSVLENEDLNNVTTTGNYFVSAAKNRPIEYVGYLEVKRAGVGYVKQTYTVAYNTAYYIRICDGGTWKAWVEK